MHHKAIITFGKKENRPFHAECSCETAADFGSNQEARDYLAMHLVRLQGINSAEFVDETVKPLPEPVQGNAPPKVVPPPPPPTPPAPPSAPNSRTTTVA